ncbi:two-component system sensor histidine kinase NtrB [Haloplanus aerogenes]|uniref:histidine kinase n=1 Tax=Haloplanus aerogenes TaxID=660522 RepID=A0A3M0DPX8_9EURY|nr:HAMP domain-containing sensor histidine kinase [Haloplanus aerogenes]AZH24677.1 PAS domain-containing sensor histidine kinase [Haloplanus aerogenes]RMB23664.1 PAS/PAC sensor signal transduction histidine kinase [Haloplanus aerogenes]
MRVSSLGRLIGTAVVGGLGVALMAVWYAEISGQPWWSPVTVAPFGLAVLLLAAAVWLFRSDLDGRIALRVPLTTVVGMLVFGSFGVFVAFDLLSTVTDVRSTLVVLHFVSVGGAVGVLVGLFAAKQATTIRTLRTREVSLRRSRDEYQDLFDGIGDTVLVHDTDGVIIAANDTAHDRLGYDAGQLVGRRIDVVENGSVDETDADDADSGDEADVDDRPTADRLVYETVHTTADGDTIPVEVSATFIRYDGAPAVLSVARDIAQRRASERELERKRDQLRALNRVLRHDIRNDMQIVLGLGRLLHDHVDDEGEEYLRTIIDTGEHVVELTRSSRDLARTVAGETELPLESVSLADTLQAEIDRRQEAFGHATISLEGDVPDVNVQANDLLASVFRNLLNNAIQHSDRDEPEVEVTADITRGDHTAIVRVADNGPGIVADRQETVFGKGEKGIESEGTGLGLYLVQSLIDHYGGEVWIEDNEPRGTVVVVELPIAEE